MGVKDWIALVGILATLTIALVNLFVNRRREKLQQERDDKLRKEQQAREDSLLEEQRKREAERQKKERTYVPQIEFNIHCNFYGPVQDHHLVEVLLTVHNQEFRVIRWNIKKVNLCPR